MKAVVISIGNTDNKLSQKQWSEFVQAVGKLVEIYSTQTHFFGGSVTWAAWQNVLWLCDFAEYMLPSFMEELTECRQKYNQDSVAYIEGKTLFL